MQQEVEPWIRNPNQSFCPGREEEGDGMGPASSDLDSVDNLTGSLHISTGAYTSELSL